MGECTNFPASVSSPFDVTRVRKHFPALEHGTVLLNNAAGSATLQAVIDSISHSLSRPQVELHYGDRQSIQETQMHAEGWKVLASFVNAGVDEIALGYSSTQLFRNLTLSLRSYFSADSEMIVSTLCHEAGISAWVSFAKSVGITIKWWTPPPSTNPLLCLLSLEKLLSPKTRLVTCNHVSNVLGSINPIREIAKMVHSVPGALLSVDGVAWAPHRPIDVKELDVDFYTFSWYKVCGPHIGQMYARRTVQDRAMRSLNHFFLDSTTVSVKLSIGVPPYELEDSLPSIVHYLQDLGWANIISHETALTEQLLGYLRSKPDTYTILGEPSSDPSRRVSLIAFRVRGQSSQEIAEKVHSSTNFRITYGNCYSYRPVHDVLGLPEDGIIRVSFLHYNTLEEVAGFIEVLDRIVDETSQEIPDKFNRENGASPL